MTHNRFHQNKWSQTLKSKLNRALISFRQISVHKEMQLTKQDPVTLSDTSGISLHSEFFLVGDDRTSGLHACGKWITNLS